MEKSVVKSRRSETIDDVRVFVKAYPFRVVMTDNLRFDDAYPWCRKAFGAIAVECLDAPHYLMRPEGRWCCLGRTFCFKTAQDATLFRLWFG